MTVLCYRDGVLAADRMCSTHYDLINGYHTKIHSGHGLMWGGCGSAQDCAAFSEWVRIGRPIDARPELDNDKDTGFIGIVIETDGAIRHYDGKLVAFPIENPFCAIGSGDMVAYGAMEMGATSERAVEIASKYILGCGGGVDVLRLESPPPAAPAPASGGQQIQ
jgi:hypothetical protein